MTESERHRQYEAEKKRIAELGLDHREYEQAIKELVERLGI